MSPKVVFGIALALLASSVSPSLSADDSEPQTESVSELDDAEVQDAASPTGRDATQPPAFELSEDVRAVLVPLFSSIVEAEVTRATVEMLQDSLMQGTVMESEKSTYQIASTKPDKFTIYLKEPERRTRIYCDGETATVAVESDAYFQPPEAINNQQAVFELPVPMGTYPEPLLALTLAGVDPALSFVSGMKSIDIVDEEDFRGQVPAVHLRGVQLDSVTWDLWILKADPPKPLRLLVDITPLLIASDQVHVPAGYSQQVRFDFVAWRVSGDVPDKLFTFRPARDARRYTSLQDYYESQTGVTAEHPLLGKRAPLFRARTLGGKIFASKSIEGKVLVLDFWATWCKPCLESMPLIKEIADQYDGEDVVSIALNTGEQLEIIAPFLAEYDFEGLRVVLDPEGKIAAGFKVNAIPQTIIIGKNGAIESVHFGFGGEAAVRKRLTDELDVLSIGGRIATVDE